MHSTLSRRVGNLRASPIREILAVIDRPGMVSFAGGLPAPESFPTFSLDPVPRERLQYGASEGDSDLREVVTTHLRALGLRCNPAQVLILTGSQQGIDLAAKLFVDEGTPVAVEAPTYLAALQVFRFFGAHFVALEPSRIDVHSLKSCQAPLLYLNPTFQNPTGRCYTSAERRAMAQACDQAGVTLFEDDPYRDLVYEPCDRDPICIQLQRASWIYQGSYSKSLAPGLRLGFLAASEDLIPYLTRLKQAADLHSNRISQWLVLSQLRDAGRERRLSELAQHYKDKRDRFEQALRQHMQPWATWTAPPGGLFFWLRLKAPLDTRQLLARAIERGVAFMPGESFYPDEAQGLGSMRLNFSHACAEQAERGLAILADLLKQASSEHGDTA